MRGGFELCRMSRCLGWVSCSDDSVEENSGSSGEGEEPSLNYITYVFKK